MYSCGKGEIQFSKYIAIKHLSRRFSWQFSNFLAKIVLYAGAVSAFLQDHLSEIIIMFVFRLGAASNFITDYCTICAMCEESIIV